MGPMAKKYYEGGHRIVVNGIPCRWNHIPSENEMAIISGQSNTKKLKLLENMRFPQTKYSSAADGVGKTGRRKFWFILDGKRSEYFPNFQTAANAYETARKEKAKNGLPR